jgi:long-chain acyl-CoA synthetase
MSQENLKTAPQIMIDQGLAHPQKPRFHIPMNGGFETVVWSDYLDKVASLSIFLRERGVGSGIKGAVYADTSYQWACAGLAIQGAGGALVPIYPSNTGGQVKYVLDHSDSKVCFIQGAYLPILSTILDSLKELSSIVVLDICSAKLEEELYKIGLDPQSSKISFCSFDHAVEKGGNGTQGVVENFQTLVSQIQPDDIGQILYTSGTTGDPKGVELSHANVGLNGEDWLQVLGSEIPENRVDLLWLPLSHIFGWGEIGLGNSLLFETYFSDPRTVLEKMPEIRPSVFMSVPVYWEKLYLKALAGNHSRPEQIEKLRKLTGGNLQFCLSGGAGLKREVKEFYLEAGMLLIEGYGLTECSPTLTMNSAQDFNFDSVGKPFPSVQVRLAEDGEILAKGANVFHGYYKNAEATAQAFNEEGWFLTGDLGEWTEDGFLKIVGRKKDILVTAGGKNISPQLIEQHFADNPVLENVVLYGNEKKYLCALVTLRKEAVDSIALKEGLQSKDYKELIQMDFLVELVGREIGQVNETLASYETIKKFFIHFESLSIEKGQLTPSFKIRRKVIHQQFEKEYEKLYV